MDSPDRIATSDQFLAALNSRVQRSMSNLEIAEIHFELLMRCSPSMIRAAVRTFYPLTATTLIDEHLLSYLQDRREELKRRVVETLDHLDQTRLNVVCPRPELVE